MAQHLNRGIAQKRSLSERTLLLNATILFACQTMWVRKTVSGGEVREKHRVSSLSNTQAILCYKIQK